MRGSDNVERESRLSAEELRGFATIAGLCAEALLTLPDEALVERVRRVQQEVGEPPYRGMEGKYLVQRYYDRFFVPASSCFVPLAESCVRAAHVEGGVRRFGSFGGMHAAHVLRCYQAAGFDCRAIAGYDLAVKNLKPDSMACELLFMAALAEKAGAADGNSCDLLVQFADEHAARWMPDAADALRERGEDLYSQVCGMAARAVADLVSG